MSHAVRVSRCESSRRPLRLRRRLVPYLWPVETRSTENASSSLDGLRQEYSEACSYHRHYSVLRLGMLGVYFAVIGVISSVAFGVALGVGGSIRFAIALLITAAGLFLTLAFWILEALFASKIRYFDDVLGELESRLDYRLLKDQRGHGFKAGTAIRLLYALFAIAWLSALLLSI